MAKRKRSRNSAALAILRDVAHWTQKRLAEAAGMTQPALSDLERGDEEPSLETLYRMASFMGLDAGWVDLTLGFLAAGERMAAAGAMQAETKGALDRQVEAFQALAGPAAEDFVRAVLTRFVRAARAAAEEREARELWARLAFYSFAQQRAIVTLGKKFQKARLCILLCEESEKAAADDAGRALALARLAQRVADLAPGTAAERARLRAYAGFHLGNALRVQGNLRRAEAAFARAKALWAEGAAAASSLDLDEGRVLDLEASLRREQRRLQEALALLDRALELDRTGERSGRLLIKRAKTLEEMDDYEAAIETLHRAAPRVDGKRDPRLRLCLRFNLAYDLTQVGRFGDAAAALSEVKALTLRIGNGLDRVRLAWLEGLIVAGLGRTEEAIVLLSRARHEFAERGIPYDTALVTLDLSLLYLGQGRPSQVKTLARQSGPVFESQGVHREALAAFALFRRAAEEEKVTVELARRLRAYFRRAQHDPELHFED